MSTTKPAAFLDRDGTLNVEVDYLHRVEDFRWIPGAVEAVRRLNAAGWLVIVVTNQAGVARGYYPESAVEALHAHMQAELARYGSHIDAYYYSPHHPEGTVAPYNRPSPMRKPAAGMLERAVREWPIDASRSVMIGDKNSDVDAGRALGLTTYLVETGYGRQERPETRADFVVPDLAAAVDHLLRHADA